VRAGLAALALATAACGSETAPPDAGAAVWRLDSVGAITDPAFVRIRSVISDSDGNVYVADQGGASIRVYGPDGALRRTIGRKGAGPAEFADIYDIGWFGDTLVAIDPGNARMTLLSRDGVPISTRPVQPLTGGDLWLSQSGPRDLYARGYRIVDQSIVHTFIHHTPAGPADTLVFPPDPDRATAGIDCMMGETISIFSTPFGSRAVYAVSPAGRLAVGRTGAYRIHLIGPAGDTVQTFSRPVEPIPIPDSAWTAGTADYSRFKAKYPGARCQPARFERPAAQPPIRMFRWDDAGRLWVEATTPGGYRFDVFAPDGALLGSSPAPPRDEDIPWHVRGGRLYTVLTDEDGAQTVRVHAVRTP